MSLAFIFPGQGSQTVGMGADLAEAFATAREVLQEVDDPARRGPADDRESVEAELPTEDSGKR